MIFLPVFIQLKRRGKAYSMQSKNALVLFCAGFLSWLFSGAGCGAIPPKNSSPEVKTNICLADPSIFSYNGKFYLYGTVEGRSGSGFLAYNSLDLKKWELASSNDGYVLRKGEAFGTTGFWAPQVFRHRDSFYMAYVANEQIAFAKSSRPEGPFIQTIKEPLAAPVKQIDPFVFIDEDGKKYLYHVRLTGGNKIFVAEMRDDFSGIKTETLRECIVANEYWENTKAGNWPVAEGPAVFKHKGTYYLIYSANDFRNPDYAVGYATSNSPLGPWKKQNGNPIISRTVLGENGPGHGDFFYKGNDLYYVFHTHHAADKVGPRKTALIKLKFVKAKNEPDRLEAAAKSFRFLYQ